MSFNNLSLQQIFTKFLTYTSTVLFTNTEVKKDINLPIFMKLVFFNVTYYKLNFVLVSDYDKSFLKTVCISIGF